MTRDELAFLSKQELIEYISSYEEEIKEINQNRLAKESANANL